ncbi:MAG: ATP-binding protein [Planctomycetota bacterium]
MIVAIASGKGGTGKTTVAVNFAKVLSEQGRDVQLLDCDVEEPNCHIFVKPEFETSRSVAVPVPEVDEALCTLCGECADVCQFNAIACLKKSVLVFPELCHGCGGCWLVCPAGAITPTGREVGVVETGEALGFAFAHGRLRIGEAMSPPLIKAVKRKIDPARTCIIDAPPGTSCPVIEAVKGADFLLLVTEPTPFGLNDLRLAVEMARELRLPRGVVINRCDIGDGRLKEYCAREKIAVLGEIPDDRRIAEAYSRGELVVDALPEYGAQFETLWTNIEERLPELHEKVGR